MVVHRSHKRGLDSLAVAAAKFQVGVEGFVPLFLAVRLRDLGKDLLESGFLEEVLRPQKPIWVSGSTLRIESSSTDLLCPGPERVPRSEPCSDSSRSLCICRCSDLESLHPIEEFREFLTILLGDLRTAGHAFEEKVSSLPGLREEKEENVNVAGQGCRGK